MRPENICLDGHRVGNVRLIDFGTCAHIGGERNSYSQSRWYRAPEVILGLPFGAKADVWSLGCTLAELYLGRSLFRGTVERVLAAQHAACGPLPSAMLDASPLHHLYFTTERRPYEVDPPGAAPGAYVLVPRTHDLAELLACNETNDGFSAFLETLLQLDPARRPTARDALAHPWLARVRARRARRHWAVVRDEVRRRAFYAPLGAYAFLMGSAHSAS